MNGSQKNKSDYLERLRLACSEVSKKIKKVNEKLKDKGEWQEHEATFTAMLYHELIVQGIDYSKLSLENQPDTNSKNSKGKKIDLWFEEYQGDKLDITYAHEIKLIGVRKVRGGEFGLRFMNSKAGVYGDLIKLDKYLEDEKDEVGIAIAAYTGKDEISPEKIISLLGHKTSRYTGEKPKNPNLKLLVVSNGESEYA
ncbi:MAG: hypothetical protein QXU18_07020 [Thermoplasmatales archaeon]